MPCAAASENARDRVSVAPFLLWGAMLACICMALFSLCTPAAAAGGNPRYAALVMDADTGMILYQRGADKRLHPASLAKMMTLLLTFEAIENGKLSLRDRVPVSAHAAAMAPSKLDLPAGSTIRVEDAIYALVTKSANDVAVALGEKIGGSESNFARMMTRKAQEIGMSNTRFVNASGLHNPAQVTTARDMSKLALYIIHDYSGYYHYFATSRFTYRGKSYHNHNRLMETYSGMDGFKTGYIGPSGFNLVASARRDGHRLIGVVFGGQSAASRNAHMKKLLDEGFAKLDTVVMAKNVPIPGPKPVDAIRMAAFTPAAGEAGEEMEKWADLNPMLQNRTFQAIIGEGDYDPSETKRFETGLMAIAANKDFHSESHDSSSLPVPPPVPGRDRWAIQVGAFESRVKTDLMIENARRTLSPDLAAASPVIVPLKTAKGWLFRGRLSGFTQEQAMRACAQLDECLPISPQAAH